MTDFTYPGTLAGAFVVPTGASVARTTAVVAPVMAFKARNDFYTGVLGQCIGRVNGYVYVNPTSPVSRLVRLHRQKDGLVIQTKWSDATTGAYSFDYVDETIRYYVTAFDHTGTYLAVIADNLTPDLIP